jgi:hypothetical protein
MFLTVSEQLKAAKDKNDVFNILRAAPVGSANNAEATSILQARFKDSPDDLWLATQLQINGPEPLWTPDLLKERTSRSNTSHWGPEAGNIEADLSTPTPNSAVSVRTYLFPGSVPDKRALIFAGVHQSEPEGVEVAENLRSRLATDSAAGRPPAYTTIIAPNLFEDRHLKGPLKDRRSIDNPDSKHKVDPNRNFPGDVKPGLGGGSDSKKDASNKRDILDENRILIALAERFQPQRVATIHAHSSKDVQGDAPGIFVDPREDAAGKAQDIAIAEDMTKFVAKGLKPATVASTNADVNPLIGDYAQFTAREMEKRTKESAKERKEFDKQQKVHPIEGAKPPAKKGQKIRPANAPNVLYDPDAPKSDKGVSAGGWFPHPSQIPGNPSATRPGVGIYTIEVPEWRGSDDAKRLVPVEDLEAQALEEILLGTPTKP